MIRVGSSEDHGLALDVIQTNGGTQSRANVNDQVVNEYAEAIKAGATFPPIVVFYDGKKHWLADGFHRFHAYQKAGKSKVAADVRQGTRRDAILHSVGANETHGLRRTRDDKRRAVLTLLNDSEWGAKPETWIAETCRVSRTLVRAVLAEQPHLVEKQDRSTVREVTRGGTTYSMQTASIGKTGDAEKKEITSQPVVPQGIDGGAGPRQSVEPVARTALESEVIDARTDAERRADAIQFVFDRASDEGRALFLARNNLKSSDGERPVAAAGSEHHSAARNGATMEQGDVESSALARTPAGEDSFALAGQIETRTKAEIVDGNASLAAREGEKPLHSNSQSDATPSDAVAVPPAPQLPQAATAPITSQDAEVVAPQSIAKPVPAESLGDEISAVITNPQADSSPVIADSPAQSSSLASGANPKPFCLKLKDGHCKIAFETAALCAQCNAAKARAA